jgi:hypothetical protein
MYPPSKESIMRKTFAALTLGLTTFFGGLDSTPQALAESLEREAAEICGHAEAYGTLKDTGRERADCVDAIIGPRDEESVAYIDRLCIAEQIQEKVGATDRGQCAREVQKIILIGA